MPNYCYNTLIITSENSDEVKKFFEENKSINNKDSNENSYLSFSKSVPMPENEKDWYNWNCQNWGTKWDAIDVEIYNSSSHSSSENEFLIEEGTTEIIYSFSTAWGPALSWLETTAKKYPNLNFENEYSECGMNFYGKRIYSEGELTEDIQMELSEYNWDKVDKDQLMLIINDKMNEDEGSSVEDLAEEVMEGYANNVEYLDNIQSFIEDEIQKIIQAKQENDDSLTLQYDNEGKKVNILEF